MTIVAEIGDLRRFEHPRQLMSYLGLVPSEFSSGNNRQRGALTRTGNSRVRRVLIEAAWNYRHPPKISREIETRQEGLPAAIIEIGFLKDDREVIVEQPERAAQGIVAGLVCFLRD